MGPWRARGLFRRSVCSDPGRHAWPAGRASDRPEHFWPYRRRPELRTGHLASTIRERWPETVVLVNSGRVRPEPEALPDRAGFIAKPYRAAELLHQLDVLMEEHGVPILSDGDILEACHAAELAHAQADALDKPVTLAHAIAAEQAAIQRFGVGSHAAAYDARYPDAPEPRR